jgi:hypothetical protein
MKSIQYISLIWLGVLLTACQRATPEPITARTGMEFTLAPDQTAEVEDNGLHMKLVGISGDNRCPSEVECVESGFVTLVITVQKDALEPVEFTLQTFTDYNGLAPQGPLAGIQNRVEYEDSMIQVQSVLPYPTQGFDEIKASEYRVTFLVAAK